MSEISEQQRTLDALQVVELVKSAKEYESKGLFLCDENFSNAAEALFEMERSLLKEACELESQIDASFAAETPVTEEPKPEVSPP